MIGICPKCGNYAWDKIISGCEAACPKCGYAWKFRQQPIFFITGCSGVGKTTTAQALQKMTEEFVVLDADMFYSILHPQTEQEKLNMLGQIYGLSKNIGQAGKPVVWTMAGNIDKLMDAYGVHFFSKVRVLALTADESVLRSRMTNGRGIQDKNWIQSSVDYNAYFKSHNSIGNVSFSVMDCTHGAPEEVAVRVLEWLKNVE